MLARSRDDQCHRNLANQVERGVHDVSRILDVRFIQERGANAAAADVPASRCSSSPSVNPSSLQSHFLCITVGPVSVGVLSVSASSQSGQKG